LFLSSTRDDAFTWISPRIIMSWNRTYRPTQVADLHLDFVRNQIQRMMESGKIPQALLFAGPKGTGKTSTSRIIGAIVNDPKNAKQVDSAYFKNEKSKDKLAEPDDTNEFNQKIFAGTSFVVQEMDAASNRGIDDIRQLKTRAYLPPQEGKMSVFILDEAHMLTTEAFNALLKLLEEPPEHVIFILATTELHKIPGTIISRCQMVEFKKATDHEVINRLKSILLAENIKFEDEALKLIAKAADGSFRDAVKLLELSSQSGKVTISEVEVFTSANVSSEVQELLKDLLNKDESKVVKLFDSLREKSVDQKYFHKAVLELLHSSLMQNLGIKKGESVINKAVAQFLLQELSDSSLSEASPISHLKLELKILELIDRSKNKSGSGVKKNPNSTNNRSNTTQIAQADSFIDTNIQYDSYNEYQSYQQTYSHPQTPVVSDYEQAFKTEVNHEDKTDTISSVQRYTPQASVDLSYLGDANLLKEKWLDFVEQFAINNSTLAALLRSAKFVSNEDHSAVIGVYYNFHKEQLSIKKSQTAIQESIKLIVGDYVKVEFIVIDPPEKAELVEPDKNDPLVSSAMQALM